MTVSKMAVWRCLNAVVITALNRGITDEKEITEMFLSGYSRHFKLTDAQRKSLLKVSILDLVTKDVLSRKVPKGKAKEPKGNAASASAGDE